jgi:DNA repair protein RecO
MHKLKGIVLSKWDYQEKHMMVLILGEDGRTLTVTLYGAKGVGKKAGAGQIEIGFCLEFTIQHARGQRSLISSKEWKLVWSHINIRLNAKKYYLLCFFSELVKRFALGGEWSWEVQDEQRPKDELYILLGQALKSLDQLKLMGEVDKHLAYFLVRMISYLGIRPGSDYCHFCQEVLKAEQGCFFKFAESQFYCASCGREREGCLDMRASGELLIFLRQVRGTNYRNFLDQSFKSDLVSPVLFDYLCGQFQMRKSDFLTSSFVF